MAYSTGTVNDLSALRSALLAACTANGWTLDGEVLHKGAVYVRVRATATELDLLGGTGIDGANQLTGAAPSVNRISGLIGGLIWPMTYHIFIGTAPDEVYLVCNHNVAIHLWAAFGQSTVQGLTGTGAWVGASLTPNSTTSYVNITTSASIATGDQRPALFWGMAGGGGTSSTYIHHGLDGRGWSSGDSVTNAVQAIGLAGKILDVLPNAWNGESMLLPIQGLVNRTAGGTTSLVADLAHARYMRIDNHTAGEIITIGPDRWRVFPWFIKDSTQRNGASAVWHSGTFGWAIRYDGP